KRRRSCRSEAEALMKWRNWGRTQTCAPSSVAKPSSEEEIRKLVGDAARMGRHVKVVGAGHSFTDIACTDGTRVSLATSGRALNVDSSKGTLTVQAGIRLRDLNEA